MSKQVDVKALVSHVVRGDGVQKCRICMGDTSEGQVHLGDTVMMDGDKPVTLSELLETVTGVQVLLEKDLPTGVCPACLLCALNAAEFRLQCQQAASQWDLTIELLNGLSSQNRGTEKTIFALLEKSQMTIIKDESSFNLEDAAHRLNDHLSKPTEVKEHPISCVCPNCGKEFQFAHQLSHHLKESTDLQRACYICADIMPRNDLIGHMSEVHNKEPYDCKKCPAILCSYNQYKIHLSKSHAHAACACVECGRSFQTPNAFYAHVSVHKSQNCPSCDKLFRNQTCYIHHVKSCCNLDKNREDTFRTKTKVTVEVKNEISKRKVKVGLRGSANKECICDYCGKKFAGKKFVAAHIQIVHMKNTHRPCVYCGKFLAAAHMSEHVKKHEIDRSYSCEHCGVVLKTRLGYTQHLRLHTGERPYACKICGQTFSASSRRSEHIRKAHKNIEVVLKHACKFCPARFRLPYRLKKHLISVHNDENEKVTLDFECEECNEKFGSCRGLLHHSRKHQNIPFPPKKPEKTVMLKVFSEPNKTETEEKVLEETELPPGLCCNCSNTALLVWQFRHLCQQSDRQWKSTIDLLNHPDVMTSTDYKSFYICCAEETIYKDNTEVRSLTAAAARFNYVVKRKAIRPKYKKHAKIKGESKCSDCGKKFALPYYLNRHLRNTLKRACTECGKILQKDKLARHLEKIHNKIVYHCDICHKLFDDQWNLSRHKDFFHCNVSLECHVCRKGFTSDRSLAAHMYSHTLFNCSSCNTGFENRKCYIYHKERCTGKKVNTENIYECHDCGSKYTKKPSLRIHIVQKHLNVLPFVCQICGKRCSTRNHLSSHELVHKTERKVYECYCGAKMRSALGFEMHQRIHSGEKPYVCEVCGDRFLSASRRLDHIKRKHRSKELAHGCDRCDARFVRPFELKKHYRSVHLINILYEELFIPKGLCISCSSTAITAYEFRMFTRNSANLWNNCINTVETLPKLNTHKSIYAIIRDNMTLQTVNTFDGKRTDLIEHLSNRLMKKKPMIVERKPRHPRTGPACSCKDCGKTFSSPYFLNLHLRNSGQKEACWLCGAMVARGRDLREHLTIVHKTEMFLCPDCPNLFKCEQDRKRHLKKYHGPGNLTCSDCGRTFQRNTSFEVHTQMHAVRTCRACGAQFTNRGCYREHRSKCEPDAKPDRKTVPRSRRSNVRDPATFTCDYCGKTYHSRPQLKNHIMWIHMDVRPHQCQWCGKRFYTPARLAEHTVVHTRVRNFECDICNAKLVSKMAAVYHRRRHTGERPYECPDCGERFISSSRRSEHAKRRHNKGLRLQCLHCHATFVRNHELKKHIDKVHNSENNDIVVKVKKVKEYPVARV